jgi:hypothetical protein
MTSSSKVESVLSLILFLSFVFDPSILKEGSSGRIHTAIPHRILHIDVSHNISFGMAIKASSIGV